MTNHTAPNHAPSHSRRVRPQPMLVVPDVPATSRWYQQVLGAVSGHGGPEYEQVLVDDDNRSARGTSGIATAAITAAPANTGQ